MSNVIHFYNLDNPKRCREFLKQLRVGLPPGSAITHLYEASGRAITIDEASDEQVLQFCQELAQGAAEGPREGA